MDDFSRALDSRVSQDDWNRMAGFAGVSPAELKASISSALQSSTAAWQSAPTHQTFKVPATTKSAQCETQDFEISLFKIIGVAGSLTLCGTSTSDWSAELQVCLLVAGSKVWCTTYKFDPHNLGVCFSPSVGVAKADLCFALQINGNRVCFNINGKACIWTFGWHCGDFNVTPFCLPLP
ncbi:MAG TPA: hypothetical protein VG387_00620 [Rhizomicrobium sp.]|jgi:hypothetical protein|nr:hypothetical protein [Rhizomicrobium sp.]